MLADQETYPLLNQQPRSEDYPDMDEDFGPHEAPEEDQSATFIGDIEDIDNEGGFDSYVSVGLSTVTLFPTRRLKKEEDVMPDAECLLLSICGMCLDDDQMLSVAQVSDAYQQDRNDGERKPYVPPPVKWSQPCLIVQPEEPGEYEEPELPPRNKKSGAKQVKFDRTTNQKASQKMILLHGRVARALGIRNGEKVTVLLAGNNKRQVVRASVDDRASFNAVLEADWLEVLENTVGVAEKKRSSPRKDTLLRSIDLKVSTEMDEFGDWNRGVRFQLTPRDRLRQGILYFDGSIGVNHPRHNQGLVAGTGFCIYSCTTFNVDNKSADTSSSDSDGRPRERFPRNQTQLVSSFRFLGRPYCTNHAEYSALIEGLEWLFRFQFQKVYIVGAPEVVDAVRKLSRHEHKHEPESDDEDDDLDIPQLQRASSIAQGMIDRAKSAGVEIAYCRALDDETWEAGELADKAIDENRNSTQVFWDNIREAKSIDSKYYSLQSSLTYSEDSAHSQKVQHCAGPMMKQTDVQDEWSLLKGEEVLDEEFMMYDAPVTRYVYPPDEACASDGPETPPPIKSTAHSEKKAKREPTKVQKETKAEVPFDERHNYTFEAEEEKVSGSDTVEKEEEGFEVKDESDTKEPCKRSMFRGASLREMTRSASKKGGKRWQKFAKAIRHRRMQKSKSEGYLSVQSDAASQADLESVDDRSIWMAPSADPTSSANIDSRNDSSDEEEKVSDLSSSEDEARLLCGTIRTPKKELVETNKKPVQETSSPSGLDSICLFMDLDFLQSAQVVADDMAWLFRGAPSGQTTNINFDVEEEKSASPDPSPERTQPKTLRAPSPEIFHSTPEGSLADPPATTKFLSPLHENILSPSPPAPLVGQHQKRYADV